MTELALVAVQIGVGLLLSYLTRPAPPRIEGPRLNDLSVSGSSYGEPWPIPYGTVRLPTNMIWNQPIIEVKTSQNVGGKGLGGSGATQVSYEYFADFAIGICAGPVDRVIQILADGKLLYDTTGTSKVINVYEGVSSAALGQIQQTLSADTTIGGLSAEYSSFGITAQEALLSAIFKTPGSQVGLPVRIYNGDESQVPDPLIESIHGKGNVPAYRGLCYIVFEKLPIRNFGNRIPNITVVVTKNATSTVIVQPITAISSVDNGGIAFDTRRRKVYGVANGTSTVVEYDNLTQIARSTLTGAGTTSGFNVTAGKNGQLYMSIPSSDNFQPIQRVDPISLSRTALSAAIVNAPIVSMQAIQATNLILMGKTITFVFVSPNPGGLVVFQDQEEGGLLDVTPAGLSTEVAGTDFSQVGAVGGQLVADHINGIVYGIQRWTTGSDDPTGPSVLWKFTITAAWSSGAQLAPIINAEIIHKFPRLNAVTGFSTTGQVSRMFYVRGDNSLILQGTNGETLKYDITSDTIVARTFALGSFTGAMKESNITGGVFAFITSSAVSGTIYEVSVSDLTVLRSTDLSTVDSLAPIGLCFFDEETYSVTTTRNGMRRYFLNRAQAGGQPLSDIVSDLCLRSGLLASEIDVTELTGITVKGATANKQSSARSNIEPLMQAYFFDMIEEDNKLKAKLRGRAPTRTIPFDELGELKDQEGLPDPTSGRVVAERLQDVEIPRRVTVIYTDIDRSYQSGSQAAQRVTSPGRTMFSDQEQSIELPIVLNATEAKQIAEQWLYGLWNGRMSFKTVTHWGNIDLSPGDVITLPLTTGDRNVRVIGKEVGANLVVNLECQQENPAVFSPISVANDGYGFVPQIIGSSSLTQPFFLDIPLLREVDSSAGQFSRAYFAMAGYGSGWKGGVLLRSQDDGVNYSQVGSSFDDVPWGTTSVALANPPNGDWTVWDNTSTVTFYPQVGEDEFSSVTDLEVLNGANPVLVGNEIIQFVNATMNSNGSITLSRLLRGRLGTDQYIATHVLGERVILLKVGPITSHKLPLALVNSALLYKAVTIGRLIDEADNELFTYTGADLKPYSPVILTGSRSGSNLTIAWKPRTRLNRAGLIGPAPLNEAFEQYSIDLSQAGTIFDTLTVNTARSVVYSSAEFQAASGLSDAGYPLVNPGFEAGSIAGWTVTAGPSTWIVEQSDGLITAPHSGTYFASAVRALETDYQISQTWNLYSDLGFTLEDLRQRPALDLRCWAAKISAHNSTFELSADWLTAGGTVIQTDTTGAVNVTGDGAWHQMQATGIAPKNAVQIRVNIKATKVSAPSIVGSFDDFTLAIGSGVPKIKATVYEISEAVGRGFGRTGVV